MAIPGIKQVQVIAYVTYEDDVAAQLPSAVFVKDVRRGLTFTDEEALVTMASALETVTEAYRHCGGSKGIYRHVRGLSATPPPRPSTGAEPSNN